MNTRTATVERKTRETDISLTLALDGDGTCDCRTGIGFFDHMLEAFTKHGLFELTLRCRGDLDVDSHHTVEDVALVLGQALREALGTKEGICRYGHFVLPMDEALVLCAVDLSGRSAYVSDVTYTQASLGALDCECFDEFFRAVSMAAGMNIHLRQLSAPGNNHHLAEASFKAFAKALDMATSPEDRLSGVFSTKGSL